MPADRTARTLLGLCAAVLVALSLAAASPIIAPTAFALFTVAIVWPLQDRLSRALPALLAALATIIVAMLVIGSLGWVVVWGFGRVGAWLVVNAQRFQQIYLDTAAWLEGHGLYAAGLLAERFDVSWLVRLFREVSTRLHGMLSFTIVTLIFTLLGLLEVRHAGNRITRVLAGEQAATLTAAIAATARKFQTYMAVRSVMSVLTGLGVFVFALAIGLDLAAPWGAIAFALNYIPFLGPLVATVLPTIVALVQFGSWQMALFVLLSLNLIQFAIGSYLEPRVAGRAVALSPFIVLLSVFLWTFLWGIPGAFIGVPVVIAVVTICAHYPGARPIAELLSAGD
ncbi:MAG: AI-2E family transporter [Acetobacteraceae bacterium]|nr:AI-2E family transporter [Acetobacteraceae bacterium]